MPQVGDELGRELGKRLLKAGIALVGLLLIRLILTRLPMMVHAEPINISSLLGSETAVIPLPDLAKTIVDTLMFIVVIFAALDVGRLVKGATPSFPEMGRVIVLTTLVFVVAWAYSSYSLVVLPLLGDEAVYDWTFLVLGLVPLLGLAVIVYRNLDVITDLVFHSSRHAIEAVSVGRPSSPRNCSHCGAAVVGDARFCAVCGTALAVEQSSRTADIFCSACGAKNDGTASSCSSCGAVLLRTSR